MRCTVCGCDILPNSICCQNCGTRVIEMTGVNSASRGMAIVSIIALTMALTMVLTAM